MIAPYLVHQSLLSFLSGGIVIEEDKMISNIDHLNMSRYCALIKISL
jgi:hypothetical protein